MSQNTKNTASGQFPARSNCRVLIVGCGYLGSRVAAASMAAGDHVFATTRCPQRARMLASNGLEPLILNWNDPRTLRSIPQVDRVLIAVSYDRRSPWSRYESQVGGLKNLLGNLNSDANVCYISTTGVFHQTDGRWVDENSPARPRRAGGQVHLNAETVVRRMRPQSPYSVLRLAGIYGPGRVPRVADVMAGRPIRSPQYGFLNLIHVDDATTAALAAWQRTDQQMYVVADDRPVVRREFYEEIARQTDSADPVFADPVSESPLSMRSDSNKRIWNRKMKRDLVPRLDYPTYRDGLRDVLGTRSR